MPLLMVGLLLGSLAATGAEAIRPSRTDSYGDPLPHGVLARLGSNRFRCDFVPQMLEISPDMSMVAMGGFDDQISVFAYPSGLILRKIDPLSFENVANPIEGMRSLHFSPDSKRLLVLCEEAVVELDIHRNGFIQRLRRPRGTFVAVGHDLRYVVSRLLVPGAVLKFELYLYDMLQKQPVARKIGSANSSDGELNPTLSRDNRWLAFASQQSPDGATFLRLLDLRTGRIVSVPTAPSGNAPVEFAPDGRSIIVSGAGIVAFHRLIPAADGISLPEIGKPTAVLHALRFISAVHFSPDGRDLVISVVDGKIYLMDVRTRCIRTTISSPGYRTVVRMSSDGRWLAALGENVSIPEFWNASDGSPFFNHFGHSGNVNGLTFSADGRTLHSASADGTLKTWNVSPHIGKRLVSTRSTQATAEERWSSREIVTRESNRILIDVHLDESRSQLQALTEDLETLEWNASRRTPFARRPPGYTLDFGAVVSDDRVRRAIPDLERQLLSIGDVRSGRVVQTIRSGHAISSARFHPDGRTILTSDDFSEVVAWDIHSGQRLPAIPGHSGGIASRIWVERIEKVSAETILRDRATGRTLLAIAGDISRHSFTRDERMLLVVNNNVVQQIDLPTGRMRVLIGDSQGMVHPQSVAVSPDGSLVAVGYSSGEIHLLDQRPLFRDADRSPSPEEWRSMWDKLREPDSTARSYGSLVAQYPKEAIDQLRTRRLFPPIIAPERVQMLLHQLDDSSFRQREAATRELRASASTVVSALEACLKAAPSAEVENRVKRLLREETSAMPTGERLRNLRAIGLLERIGTPEVLPLLREYAAQSDPMLSFAAKDSIVRLKK